MPSAIPYLFFPGTCREAMTAYADIFGAGDLQIMEFSDLPPDESAPPMPPEAVMHAALDLGGHWIYASDEPAEDHKAMAGCNIHVSFPDETRARAAFERLAEGGEVRMAFAPQFWTPGFGTLSDRWGTRWMVSVDAPEG